MKKNLLLFAIVLVGSLTGFAQNMYSTSSNLVMLSGVLNQDTFLIESIKNKVQVNGALNTLEVIFNNQDARTVSDEFHDYEQQRGDIEIIFWNEYEWLDEYIKSTEPIITITDEINISLNGEEILVPVTITFSRLRGGQGFNSRIEIKGSFPADSLKFDFPDFDFKEEVSFMIQLMVQVRNQ